MAVTSVWPIRGRVDNLIQYVMNPEKTVDWEASSVLHSIDNVLQYTMDEIKTEELAYVTGINCNPKFAAEQFMATKEDWGKLGGRVCYHGIQSFRPGEVTAQQAHDLGVALAQELWGDRFEVVVATHCNTDCYHNHFAFNSVSRADGRKFYCTLEDERRMREVSDELCRQERLSVIENPKGRKKHHAEWMAQKNGHYTIRGGVREDIDRAIRSSATRQDFMNVMRRMGYEFKIYGKSGRILAHPAVIVPDADRPVRLDGLGEAYTLEAIERRIRENGIRRNPFHEWEKQPRQYLGVFRMKGSYSKAPKATGIRALYFYYCYKLKVFRKYPAGVMRVSIHMREDLRNMDSLIAQTALLGRENIDTMEELLQFRTKTESQISELTELREELRNAKRRADRAGDANSSEATKARITEVTSQLKQLRKEAALCSKIEERSEGVREHLEQFKQEETKRKENTRDEYWRRRS